MKRAWLTVGLVCVGGVSSAWLLGDEPQTPLAVAANTEVAELRAEVKALTEKVARLDALVKKLAIPVRTTATPGSTPMMLLRDMGIEAIDAPNASRKTLPAPAGEINGVPYYHRLLSNQEPKQ